MSNVSTPACLDTSACFQFVCRSVILKLTEYTQYGRRCTWY